MCTGERSSSSVCDRKRNRKCNRKCRGKCATGSVAVSAPVARLVHAAQQEEQEEQVELDVHRAARLQLDPLVGGEDGAPHRDLVGQLLVRLLPPRLLPVDEEDVVVRLGYMGVAGWVQGCRLGTWGCRRAGQKTWWHACGQTMGLQDGHMGLQDGCALSAPGTRPCRLRAGTLHRMRSRGWRGRGAAPSRAAS